MLSILCKVRCNARRDLSGRDQSIRRLMGVGCKNVRPSGLSRLLHQDTDFQPKLVATINSGRGMSYCPYSGGWMILQLMLSLETSVFNQAPASHHRGMLRTFYLPRDNICSNCIHFTRFPVQNLAVQIASGFFFQSVHPSFFPSCHTFYKGANCFPC